MRAIVDQRLQFDLSTLYARFFDYVVSWLSPLLFESWTRVNSINTIFHSHKLLHFLQYPVIFGGNSTIDEQKVAKLHEALGFFEIMLKGRTWAAVNNFTIADLTLTVTVAQLEMLEFNLEPYTRIRTWLQRCKDYLRPHGYDVSVCHHLTWTLVMFWHFNLPFFEWTGSAARWLRICRIFPVKVKFIENSSTMINGFKCGQIFTTNGIFYS